MDKVHSWHVTGNTNKTACGDHLTDSNFLPGQQRQTNLFTIIDTITCMPKDSLNMFITQTAIAICTTSNQCAKSKRSTSLIKSSNDRNIR